MTDPVNLNAVKWLNLCDAADKAAVRPDPCADDLALLAGRLTTVTATKFNMADTALTTSFRWDCTAYGLAGPMTRVILAPGLMAKSALVRRLLTPGEPPLRDALPVPDRLPSAEAIAADPPAWTRRADIGG